MRATLSISLVLVLGVGCGSKSDDTTGDDDTTPDACRGIGCQVVDCASMNLPPTTITGTVFAPNGTLPLNGVNVYVPVDPLPAFVEGVTCDRCSTTLPGSPVVQTVSDATGAFTLTNVPAGANIPLVITTGKWRRQVTIPTVSQCTGNSVGTSETSLPKNKAEGDIPRIAITTGDADTLECLIRKLGIADSEIGSLGDDRRIHLYRGDGTASFKGGFGGGTGNLPPANTFWGTEASLSAYDITFLSCEGSQQGSAGSSAKVQGDLNAMKAYADKGGRVFASHWHNIWVGGGFQGGGAPTITQWAGTANSIASGGVANWNANDGDPGDPNTIEEVLNPKGTLFADWMVNVGGSNGGRGQIDMVDNTRRLTATQLDTSKAELWVKSNGNNPQMFQFTTPIETSLDQRCGKVVYTDMHVSGTPTAPIAAYPDHCLGGNTLSDQEKALAFMFFDIAGCVGGLF